MTDAPADTWCPNARCRAPLPQGAETCPRCGLTLTGPEAERLLELDRRMAELWVEAEQLTRLLLPAPPDATTSEPATRVPRRRSLSGQQLLLGLGAVLTLSAVSFFLFVVWDVIGPAGQLLVVATLIAGAIWSSYAAARRGLTAAAETAAVLAAGLTALALAAAYALGWLGVDRLDPGVYAGLAAAATGVLLLAAERGVPAGTRVRTYRPVGAAALGLAPWYAFLGPVPEDAPVRFVLSLLAVAAADGLGALVALRLDARRTRLGPPVTALLLGAGAGTAYALHLLTGWEVGYDETVAVASRVAVACVLLLGPALVAAATLLPQLPLGRARPGAPAVALLLASPSLGVLLTDLPYQALLVVAAALALTLLVDALDRRPRAPGWRRAGTAWLALAVPVLVYVVLTLDALDRETLFSRTSEAGAGPGVAASTAVTLLWALAATLGAVRAHGLGALRAPGLDAPEEETAGSAGLATALLLLQAGAAEIAWALAAARVLAEVDSSWGWLVGGALAVAVNAGVAATLVRRERGGSGPRAAPLEPVLLLAASVGAFVAVTAADALSDRTLALTLIGLGVTVLAYALLPGRLALSYPGAVAVSLGARLLIAEAGLTAVEATSLPLAALLAGIGFLQARRRVAAPTMLVAGPALSVALVPTLAVAVEEGDDLRLAVVTAAALAVLAAGLWRQWRAPVTAGAGVLVVVAVTQGGPYVDQLPTVLVLGVPGALLLAAGVAWERAVLAGRRASAWYASLQ